VSEPPAYASLRRRMAAGLIDAVPTAALVVPLTVWFGSGGFVLGWVAASAYFAVCESHGGQTLGKRLARIRVLQLDGSPCTTTGAVLRNAFRAVDAFPGVYLIALVSLAGSRRRQRIGDQAAGTSVFADFVTRA
jgi:uncharacterized RDD family membrane protein YckC